MLRSLHKIKRINLTIHMKTIQTLMYCLVVTTHTLVTVHTLLLGSTFMFYNAPKFFLWYKQLQWKYLHIVSCNSWSSLWIIYKDCILVAKYCQNIKQIFEFTLEYIPRELYHVRDFLLKRSVYVQTIVFTSYILSVLSIHIWGKMRQYSVALRSLNVRMNISD